MPFAFSSADERQGLDPMWHTLSHVWHRLSLVWLTLSLVWHRLLPAAQAHSLWHRLSLVWHRLSSLCPGRAGSGDHTHC
jgi:hypothetical protein